MTREQEGERDLQARVASLAIGVLLPLVLTLTALRLAATPTFAELEFERPDFPADAYGLTSDWRAHWSRLVFAYVTGGDPSALETARLPGRMMPPGREEGADDRAFGARELRHLADVARLYRQMVWVWLTSLGALLASVGWAYARGGGDVVRAAVRRACVGVLIVCGLGVAAALLLGDRLLTVVHLPFFEAGSFLFYGNDTLIRLYPPQLWTDALAFTALFTVASASALLLASRVR